jgi:hypothetical protein
MYNRNTKDDAHEKPMDPGDSSPGVAGFWNRL